jgi:hypothetical protein
MGQLKKMGSWFVSWLHCFYFVTKLELLSMILKVPHGQSYIYLPKCAQVSLQSPVPNPEVTPLIENQEPHASATYS